MNNVVQKNIDAERKNTGKNNECTYDIKKQKSKQTNKQTIVQDSCHKMP